MPMQTQENPAVSWGDETNKKTPTQPQSGRLWFFIRLEQKDS